MHTFKHQVVSKLSADLAKEASAFDRAANWFVRGKKPLNQTEVGKRLLAEAKNLNTKHVFHDDWDLHARTRIDPEGRTVKGYTSKIYAPENVAPELFAHELGHIKGKYWKRGQKVDKALGVPVAEEARANLNALRLMKQHGGTLAAIKSSPRLATIYSTYLTNVPGAAAGKVVEKARAALKKTKGGKPE